MNFKKVIGAMKRLGRIPAELDRLQHLMELAIAQRYLFNALDGGELCLYQGSRVPRLIVSLTSYGARINQVHLAVESLLLQTLKPDKIVLWLSESEFCDSTLPVFLKSQMKRGLTVKYCKDLLSYKKLVPALQEYPLDCIVTVDDDHIFPLNLLELLYLAYIREPQFIHCYRAHRMALDSMGNIRPYRFWEHEITSNEAERRLFPTGGAGALYPPNCFDDEVVNSDIFMQLCPTADDVWFKLMALRHGTLAKLVRGGVSFDFSPAVPGSQKETLFSVNRDANDSQIRSVLERYPDIAISREALTLYP